MIYGGILCAIDVSNDPIATYESLLTFDPPAVDLLLPHANWSYPPPGSGYADWLIEVFERWYSAHWFKSSTAHQVKYRIARTDHGAIPGE